jgi:hypothetical protein
MHRWPFNKKFSNGCFFAGFINNFACKTVHKGACCAVNSMFKNSARFKRNNAAFCHSIANGRNMAKAVNELE